MVDLIFEVCYIILQSQSNTLFIFQVLIFFNPVLKIQVTHVLPFSHIVMLAYLLPLAVPILTLLALQLQPMTYTNSDALAISVTSRPTRDRIFLFPLPPLTSSTRYRVQNFLSLLSRALCHVSRAGKELHKSLDWWRKDLESTPAFVQSAEDYSCGPFTSRVLALEEAVAHWQTRETGRDSAISRHPNKMVRFIFILIVLCMHSLTILF